MPAVTPTIHAIPLAPVKSACLAGFASAVALAVVALVMALESLQRIFIDVTIQFPEAIAVAVVGLGVNLVSTLPLRDHHDHHHYVGLSLEPLIRYRNPHKRKRSLVLLEH